MFMLYGLTGFRLWYFCFDRFHSILKMNAKVAEVVHENIDIDIYSDLPDLDYSKKFKKLEETNNILLKKIKSLEENLEKALKEKYEFEIENKNLSNNISSLYLTATNEIKRKDRMMNELRKELQESKHHLRNHRYKNSSDNGRLNRDEFSPNPIPNNKKTIVKSGKESDLTCKKVIASRSEIKTSSQIETHISNNFRVQDNLEYSLKEIDTCSQINKNSSQVQSMSSNRSSRINESQPLNGQSFMTEYTKRMYKKISTVNKTFQDCNITKESNVNEIKKSSSSDYKKETNCIKVKKKGKIGANYSDKSLNEIKDNQIVNDVPHSANTNNLVPEIHLINEGTNLRNMSSCELNAPFENCSVDPSCSDNLKSHNKNKTKTKFLSPIEEERNKLPPIFSSLDNAKKSSDDKNLNSNNIESDKGLFNVLKAEANLNIGKSNGEIIVNEKHEFNDASQGKECLSLSVEVAKNQTDHNLSNSLNYCENIPIDTVYNFLHTGKVIDSAQINTLNTSDKSKTSLAEDKTDTNDLVSLNEVSSTYLSTGLIEVDIKKSTNVNPGSTGNEIIPAARQRVNSSDCDIISSSVDIDDKALNIKNINDPDIHASNKKQDLLIYTENGEEKNNDLTITNSDVKNSEEFIIPSSVAVCDIPHKLTQTNETAKRLKSNFSKHENCSIQQIKDKTNSSILPDKNVQNPVNVQNHIIEGNKQEKIEALKKNELKLESSASKMLDCKSKMFSSPKNIARQGTQSLVLHRNITQKKFPFTPISSSWSKNLTGINDSFKSNDTRKSVTSTPPKPDKCVSKKTQDTPNEKSLSKTNIMESIFGSPLKWADTEESSYDFSEISSTPIFEDSCSAQLENPKFIKKEMKVSTETLVTQAKRTVNTVFQPFTPTSKVSLPSNDSVSSYVCQDKVTIKQDFNNSENVSKPISSTSTKVEKEGSFFDKNGHVGTVKLNSNSACKGTDTCEKTPMKAIYDDSLLGEFDDTMQLISALSVVHKRVSPLTPLKDDYTAESCSLPPITKNFELKPVIDCNSFNREKEHDNIENGYREQLVKFTNIPTTCEKTIPVNYSHCPTKNFKNDKEIHNSEDIVNRGPLTITAFSAPGVHSAETNSEVFGKTDDGFNNNCTNSSKRLKGRDMLKVEKSCKTPSCSRKITHGHDMTKYIIQCGKFFKKEKCSGGFKLKDSVANKPINILQPRKTPRHPKEINTKISTGDDSISTIERDLQKDVLPAKILKPNDNSFSKSSSVGESQLILTKNESESCNPSGRKDNNMSLKTRPCVNMKEADFSPVNEANDVEILDKGNKKTKIEECKEEKYKTLFNKFNDTPSSSKRSKVNVSCEILTKSHHKNRRDDSGEFRLSKPDISSKYNSKKCSPDSSDKRTVRSDRYVKSISPKHSRRHQLYIKVRHRDCSSPLRSNSAYRSQVRRDRRYNPSPIKRKSDTIDEYRPKKKFHSGQSPNREEHFYLKGNTNFKPRTSQHISWPERKNNDESSIVSGSDDYKTPLTLGTGYSKSKRDRMKCEEIDDISPIINTSKSPFQKEYKENQKINNVITPQKASPPVSRVIILHKRPMNFSESNSNRTPTISIKTDQNIPKNESLLSISEK